MPNSKNRRRNKTAVVFGQSKWHLFNFLRSLDLFGSPIPAFNIKGDETVHTIIGGFLSAFIICLTLSFSLVKIVGVFEK